MWCLEVVEPCYGKFIEIITLLQAAIFALKQNDPALKDILPTMCVNLMEEKLVAPLQSVSYYCIVSSRAVK